MCVEMALEHNTDRRIQLSSSRFIITHLPNMANATTPAPASIAYRHEPYRWAGIVITSCAKRQHSSLPEGTLHRALEGRVPFVPYPQQGSAGSASPARMGATGTRHVSLGSGVRVFIGQLPYYVTGEQMSWMIGTAAGCNVTMGDVERIMKSKASCNGGARGGQGPRGRIPTGGLHGTVGSEAEVSALISSMHKRMLVDDTGVWYAGNAAEVEALQWYTAMMKQHALLRPAHRPYQTVVVERATSEYAAPKPVRLTSFPRYRFSTMVVEEQETTSVLAPQSRVAHPSQSRGRRQCFGITDEVYALQLSI